MLRDLDGKLINNYINSHKILYSLTNYKFKDEILIILLSK